MAKGASGMSAPQQTQGIDEVVEFATFIRERPVTCRWVDGRLDGDAELLDRLDRVALPPNWTEHPATVAKAIGVAVASGVTIRIVHPEEADMTDVAPVGEPRGPVGRRDPAPGAPEVLGDYWLG